MPPSLWREVWILAAIALTSFLLGLIADRPFLFAALGFSLYIFLTLRHLSGLHQWLQNRGASEVPDAEGLWGDVFNEIRKLVKQTEQRADQLTGMVERLQSATTAMPDGVVILTERDEIEWANATARRLLGVDFPRDAGLRLSNLVRDPNFAHYLEWADFAEPLEMTAPIDPEKQVAIQIIPYGANQKLVICRDVTRLARLEQMRRTFIANVSHELRTPLTVLGGYVETLSQMERVAPEDLKKHLATMQQQSIRMQRLVDDLLTLSRLETAPPRSRDEIVDVPDLLAGLKDQAELLSGRQHKIVLEADTDLDLSGSREELTSAFSNLINNAVRYTPAGGTVHLHWRADDEGAKFSVTDTGEGIPPEHIPRLTERFYRVDSARSRASGGTGLGLSIVKHVLMRHDASLRIESTLGQGSTFTCVFPAPRIARRTAGSAVG